MKEEGTMIKLGNDWDELLKNEFNQPYYLTLRQFLKKNTKRKKFSGHVRYFQCIKAYRL